MSDLISRQAAIEAVSKALRTPIPCYGNDLLQDCMTLAKAIVKNIPSAEPERKKGEWVEISWSELDPNVCCTSYEMQSAKCSVCGKYHTTPYLYSFDYFPYCPNCGAEMKRGK